MAGASVYNATGTCIEFTDSAFEADVEFTSFDLAGITREMIDVSHMKTADPTGNKIGNRTFLVGKLVDPGELTAEMHFNPNKFIPIHSDFELIKLIFPLITGDNTKARWEFQGAISTHDFSAPLDDKMVATATIKISGNIEIFAAT